VPPGAVGALLGNGECAICLEELCNQAIVRGLCGHVFHWNCLNAAESRMCPQCRQPLDVPQERAAFPGALAIPRPAIDGEQTLATDTADAQMLQFIADGPQIIQHRPGSTQPERAVIIVTSEDLARAAPAAENDQEQGEVNSQTRENMLERRYTWVPSSSHEGPVDTQRVSSPHDASLQAAALGPCLTQVPRFLPVELVREFQLDSPADIIGQGSYAVVCRVREHTSGKPWALKVLAKEPLVVRNLGDQAMRELTMQRNLRHPNILEVHRALEVDEHFWLVLEMAEFGSLQHLASRMGPVPEHITAFYLRQVAAAMVYLHSDGVQILHRDLKADNVLLFSPSVCKLADFGCCASFSDEGVPEERAGTVSHMAPEVFAAKPYGSAADCWSFGVLTCELALGTLVCATAEDWLQNQRQMLDSIAGYLSPALRSVLGKLFRRDQAKRLSADQILEHEPFASVPLTPPFSVEQLRQVIGNGNASSPHQGSFVAASQAAHHALVGRSAPVPPAIPVSRPAEVHVATVMSPMASVRIPPLRGDASTYDPVSDRQVPAQSPHDVRRMVTDGHPAMAADSVLCQVAQAGALAMVTPRDGQMRSAFAPSPAAVPSQRPQLPPEATMPVRRIVTCEWPQTSHNTQVAVARLPVERQPSGSPTVYRQYSLTSTQSQTNSGFFAPGPVRQVSQAAPLHTARDSAVNVATRCIHGSLTLPAGPRAADLQPVNEVSGLRRSLGEEGSTRSSAPQGASLTIQPARVPVQTTGSVTIPAGRRAAAPQAQPAHMAAGFVRPAAPPNLQQPIVPRQTLAQQPLQQQALQQQPTCIAPRGHPVAAPACTLAAAGRGQTWQVVTPMNRAEMRNLVSPSVR